MALKPYLSFSSGELDPILTDNVTLEKFNKGLSTGRNIMIGKTGSILSRFSRYHCAAVKNPDETVKIYCPPNTDYLLEFGNLYVRVYNLVDANPVPTFNLDVELVHTLVEADLPNLHFSHSKDYVYVFCAGKEVMKLLLAHAGSAFVASADIFKVLNPLDALTVVGIGSPSGYNVDYLATIVVNGEESIFIENVTGFQKPITASQSNTIGVKWTTTDVNMDEFNEVRIYSRPSLGGAYGFLAATSKTSIAGADTYAYLSDIGSLPDYSNGVQDIITKYGLAGEDVIDLHPKTGIIYQQRLILGNVEDDNEALLASRPGFQNNFYRDFPYAADSSLQFKSGTSGKARVLRLVDADGLIAFTTNGVYVNNGLLSVSNLAMDRKGSWIINELIPPLVIPGGVFFVDRANTIRQLIFSQEIQAYESQEQTIFSNHLFKKRTIKTWAFQDGIIPIIIVTFSDGTFATFTYNFEHQMKAWTRHDSKYPVEQVEGTEKSDRSYFVVNKNGTRYIEVSLPRRALPETIITDSEYDKLAPTAFMDSIKTTRSLINDLFSSGENFIITPNTPNVWDGPLNLTTNALLDLSGYAIGYVFRVFDPTDGSTIDLTVTDSPTGTSKTVQPSEEFPSALETTARVYDTFNVITGLTHLEGESVSVMVDGYIVTSPYNDQENYPILTVTGGSITLPDDLRGAIINVGRPIVADIMTLNISTLEQSPTLIESLNVNKLYIRVNETRGLYCSNNFPEEKNNEVDGTSVFKMENLDKALIPVNNIIIGNRYLAPVSMRIEKTIRGNWNNQGRISIRQVDPFHFEILSIIPDVTVLKRSDR